MIYLLWLKKETKMLSSFFSKVSIPSWPSAKSAHRLAIGPLALGQTNTTVCSLACRWRLGSALRVDQEYCLNESGPHP